MTDAMSGPIAQRLNELGITLPAAPAPAANYVPALVEGGQLWISGQLPMRDGTVAYMGKLGADVSNEDGAAAARLCAINILAQAQAALQGDLERIVRVLRLTGFVNATPDFTDHPSIINGASNLMADVLAERGHHTRAAVGMGSLPFGVPVEIDAVIAVRD